MHSSGLRSRLRKLEKRLHPRKPWQIVVWDGDGPCPDVSPGAVLIQIVVDDDSDQPRGSGPRGGYTP